MNEVKSIISSAVSTHYNVSNARIERKVLTSLTQNNYSTDKLADILSSFMDPAKATLITHLIAQNFDENPNLVKQLREAQTVKEPVTIDPIAQSNEKLQALRASIEAKKKAVENATRNRMSQIMQQTTMRNLQRSVADEKPDVTKKDSSHFTPSLKANQRMAQKNKKYTLNQYESEKPKEAPKKPAAFIDSRINTKPMTKPDKKFDFVDHEVVLGEIEEREKKQKFENLNKKILQAAQKTGIAEAARFSYFNTKLDSNSPIPIIEWWDAALFQKVNPGEMHSDIKVFPEINQHTYMPGITDFIEHPEELRPANVPAKPIVIEKQLTKEEMRKKRRDERAEKNE